MNPTEPGDQKIWSKIWYDLEGQMLFLDLSEIMPKKIIVYPSPPLYCHVLYHRQLLAEGRTCNIEKKFRCICLNLGESSSFKWKLSSSMLEENALKIYWKDFLEGLKKDVTLVYILSLRWTFFSYNLKV